MTEDDRHKAVMEVNVEQQEWEVEEEYSEADERQQDANEAHDVEREAEGSRRHSFPRTKKAPRSKGKGVKKGFKGKGDGKGEDLQTFAIEAASRAPREAFDLGSIPRVSGDVFSVRKETLRNAIEALDEAGRAAEHARRILESGAAAFDEQQRRIRSALLSLRRTLEGE